jgi:hypothetical protein
MSLRFPCLPGQLLPGGVLASVHGAGSFHRPDLDVYFVGPGGLFAPEQVRIDTASDFIVLRSSVATALGFSLPFPRRQAASGAGGHGLPLSFPPLGLIGLFVTDYTEYCYLPTPLIGFHHPSMPTASQRAVLGLTGFLRYFRFVLDHGPAPPVFELHPLPGFPGQTGPYPHGRPLADFLRELRGP